jgi:hypothetical protein
VLRYAIAFAFRRSRKIIRGLKEGLTEEERYAATRPTVQPSALRVLSPPQARSTALPYEVRTSGSKCGFRFEIIVPTGETPPSEIMVRIRDVCARRSSIARC